MNDDHCFDITTRISKDTINPLMSMIDDVIHELFDVDDASKVESKKLVTSSELAQKSMSVGK